MHIPLRAALFGLELVGNLVSGGDRPAPASAPTVASAAFAESMQVANMIGQVGDRLTAAQHQTVDQLVANGQIPQALDMLQRLASGQPLATTSLLATPYPNGIALR